MIHPAAAMPNLSSGGNAEFIKQLKIIAANSRERGLPIRTVHAIANNNYWQDLLASFNS